MERLLKIVGGPMKGAEIALVPGTRVKVGRGADCDIVIADATLAETAFELDVADAAVALVGPDGAARELRPFEIHEFGMTSFALGPAEGRWEALRPAAAEGTVRRTGRGLGIGCLVVAVLVLIVLGLFGLFRTDLAGRLLRSRRCAERAVPSAASAKAALKELAAQHGIGYAERDGRTVLAGNLAHRGERLALRALALAADRHCVLELSDDETLANAAEALLFTVTEGALKLSAASNRTVAVSGYAPTAAALGAAVKALRADVPWTEKVDVSAVTVGGPVPTERRDSAFAVSGVLSGASAELPADGAAAETPDIRIIDVDGRTLPRDRFPVAGILTRPYPCVVLRDGHRVVEGGLLGAYAVVRIGADELELKRGDGKANWKP